MVTCKECGKECKTERGLRVHISKMHGILGETYIRRHPEEQGGFKCPVCGVSYLKRNSFRSHLRRRHGILSTKNLQQYEVEKDRDKEQPRLEVTPKILANELLDKLISLNAENVSLKVENKNLKDRIRYLDSVIADHNAERDKEFQEKLSRAVATNGEDSLGSRG